MKRMISSGTWMMIGVMFCIATICHAQPPEMPQPTKEHELLSQFAGEWEMTAETVPVPGQETMKCEGMESAKMVGGFWLVSQGEATMMDVPVTSVMTIGFDPEAKKYVGTFLCSMDSTLWKYEGSMDESGKELTLEAEGPSMLDHTKTAKYRETLELKDQDHKVFTSFMQADDGNWVKIVTVEYRRKK